MEEHESNFDSAQSLNAEGDRVFWLLMRWIGVIVVILGVAILVRSAGAV